MKKIIVFYNFKGAAELDWLLPVLFKLKDKYELFTIFKNIEAYKSLKSDKKNFKFWKKISKGSYIEKKSQNFFYKILIYFFERLSISKFLLNNLREKIYNINYLREIIKKKLKYKKFKISYFFSEFGFNSGWVGLLNKDIIKKNENIKFIHFPSTPQIYINKINNKFALRGDILLVNSYLDKKAFTNFIDKKKIFVSGNPKYDPWWIRKNFGKENMQNKIVIAYNSKFDFVDEKYSQKLKDQLISLIKILNLFKKEVVFKIHPTKNSKYYKVILNKYADFKWKESNKNLIELTKNSLCLITHPNSAAGFDAVMNSNPVIQLWPIIDVEFNNKTSYEKLNLVIRTNSVNDFKKKINLIINEKSKYKNLVKNSLDKIYPPKIDTANRILKIINQI
tara:strand:+ start:456 stop:1634 length:1179 start_codon:yes stop_codon:yes gene_type:complete